MLERISTDPIDDPIPLVQLIDPSRFFQTGPHPGHSPSNPFKKGICHRHFNGVWMGSPVPHSHFRKGLKAKQSNGSPRLPTNFHHPQQEKCPGLKLENEYKASFKTKAPASHSSACRPSLLTVLEEACDWSPLAKYLT